jgi:hypothetical protein
MEGSPLRVVVCSSSHSFCGSAITLAGRCAIPQQFYLPEFDELGSFSDQFFGITTIMP